MLVFPLFCGLGTPIDLSNLFTFDFATGDPSYAVAVPGKYGILTIV
jgi:hypothetical protein